MTDFPRIPLVNLPSGGADSPLRMAQALSKNEHQGWSLGEPITFPDGAIGVELYRRGAHHARLVLYDDGQGRLIGEILCLAPDPKIFRTLGGWLGMATALGALVFWVWAVFFAGWGGEAIDRVIHSKHTSGGGSKLGVFIVFVGWLILPILAYFTCGITGDVLNEKLHRARYNHLAGRLRRELAPWLVERLGKA